MALSERLSIPDPAKITGPPANQSAAAPSVEKMAKAAGSMA